MQNIGPYLVGVAFWIFIGAVAVAGIVTDYKRRRGNVEVLRMAIEKGQQLDPAVIEKLMSHEQRSDKVEPLHVKLGGIITIAAGFGFLLLAASVNSVTPLAYGYILGTGWVALCVGVGLLIAAKVLAKARASAQPHNDRP